MDIQTLGIITLLRSCLNNEKCLLPNGFDLSSAISTFSRHGLVGIAFRGAALCGISTSDPAMQKLMAALGPEVSRSRRQMAQLRAMYALFDANGIDYLPLKGAYLKALYPKPEFRSMGDADILIREEQYPAIRPLMQELGMQEKPAEDYHYAWHNTALDVELHIQPVPASEQKRYAYYQNVWSKAIREEGSNSAYRMREEDHFIYLLAHFAKHYRHSTISIKNICDFWVFRKAYPDMDEAYLTTELEKMQLLGFYQNILMLLDSWFRGSAPAPVVERMTQEIFRGGIYDAGEGWAHAMALNLPAGGSSSRRKKVSWVLWRLFPPTKLMRGRYPVLEKAPALLPVFWCVRWAEAVFRPQLKNDIRSLQSLLRADDEDLSKYERQLSEIGIDSHDPPANA